jgi:hypothetical protein
MRLIVSYCSRLVLAAAVYLISTVCCCLRRAKSQQRPDQVLSDGSLTHDARFQTIDEHKTEMKSSSERTEISFVDSYKYDIAAYVLAELLGLEECCP